MRKKFDFEQAMAFIRSKNPELAAKIMSQGGCVTADDVPGLVAVDRNLLLLVRCNAGRFLTPADSVKHFVDLITEYGDMKRKETGSPIAGEWVRDVSIPA